MSKSLTLDEIKQTELLILGHIDTVCKKHHLRYYLAYGTLLGAIRHKGFIPWDDDVDIYMPREDYARFIRLMSEDREGKFKLLSMYNAPDYYYEYAKVVDLRTRVVYDNLKSIEDDGVWVDIFPLDDAPKWLRMAKWFLNLLVAFRILSVYQKFPSYKYNMVFYPLWLLSRMIGHGFFLRLSDAIARSGSNSDYVGYMCSMGVSKYYFPKKWCEAQTQVEFEGEQYPAFKDYHPYLTYQYGDYMQLPPEDKRVSHPVVAFWK